MKRAAYFFFFGLLVGCGSNSELRGNRIRIHYRDSLVNPHEYYLLSVRDSAIVVSTGFYDPSGPPELVLISKINRIYTANTGKGLVRILSGLAGAAVFLVADIILSNAFVNEEGAGMQAAFLAPVAIFVGASLGDGVGNSLSHDEMYYTPSNPHDLKEIKELARYPETEPPELQKIK
jgi:hypothetical protein